jgi:xanthine dehydrogenase YagS FAD-binding subunit
MSGLSYLKAPTVASAIAAVRGAGAAEVVAGGTDLLQRLEEHVLPPRLLVDISAIEELRGIDVDGDTVWLGALVRLSEVIDSPLMQDAFPAIVEALTVTASPQVRNLATLGGNPLQKTRCLYFRDNTAPCNKREPGTGCGALAGRNRINAVLGGSEHCIATHASDFAVTLAALDATVVVASVDGERTMPFHALHRLPGDTPHREHNLETGEIIKGYRLEKSTLARQSHYLKVRDRSEFEWAIASAAVAMELDDAGRITAARVAVGGVATKPWRLPKVEGALAGRHAGSAAYKEAARLATDGAMQRGDNAYKLELLPRTIARALVELEEQLR